MTTAKAAVFVKPGGAFEVRDFTLPAPDKGLALVKMLASGICGTDIHIVEGKIGVPMLPMVIGHEFVGEIVGIDPRDSAASGLRAGDRVIVSVVKVCGECAMCQTGESATCHNLGVTYFHAPDVPPHLFGGYADHTYAPVANLLKIPDDIPAKTAAIFACAGPTVINAFRCCGGPRFQNDTLVVQGLGPVGLFVVLYARAHGVDNIVAISTGRNAKRQELAMALGASHVISIADTSREQRIQQVMDISGGFGADCVVEASGNPDAFTEGMDMLRSRGVYLVPGLYSDRGEIAIKPHQITFKALQIIGSAQFSSNDQAEYISFLRAHDMHWPAIDAVCTHEWTIDDVNTAIDTCRKGESVKAIFVNNSH